MLAKTALQPLVLALFVTLTPELVHRAKLLFWVENKQFLWRLIFKCVRSLMQSILCSHICFADTTRRVAGSRDKWPGRLGVA